MKKLPPGKQSRVLHRVLNARQFALKLIANVTYGYTAASFSKAELMLPPSHPGPPLACLHTPFPHHHQVRPGVLPRLLKEILATRVMVKKAMKKLPPGKQSRVLHRVLNARQFALKLIANVRPGVLPRLLKEILATRVMVKKAMKKLPPGRSKNTRVLHRVLNARQFALKLIANVTYGYTAASFSGRMPMAELADSIVQAGRTTLERAIALVNSHPSWNARVVYGDTDSMFVLLEGRTREQAFTIGNEIVTAVTTLSPAPVALKLEKVYHPCVLQTKKRYVGLAYESPAATCPPVFDAKGIETVRRDGCPAVSKLLEKSLKILFSTNDLSRVRSYLVRQWQRMLQGRVSLQDFIFAQEVRLGTYSTNPRALLPPAAIVATKAMQRDPRAEPKYKERVQYVIVCGDPGSRLVDLVVEPRAVVDSQCLRLNVGYYITRKEGEGGQAGELGQVPALVLTMRAALLEKEYRHLSAICFDCGAFPAVSGTSQELCDLLSEAFKHRVIGDSNHAGFSRCWETLQDAMTETSRSYGQMMATLTKGNRRRSFAPSVTLGRCRLSKHALTSRMRRELAVFWSLVFATVTTAGYHTILATAASPGLWELVSLKRVLAESSPGALSAYSDTEDPCSGAWGDRVTCNEAGQIITLNFTAEGLTGPLPGKELSRFRTLQTLNFGQNSFTGKIPPEMASLTSLTYLSLAFNNLTGKVPSWLGLSFLNLVELHLSNNLLEKPLPESIGGLQVLRTMSLAFNSLTGTIPASIGSMRSLQALDLQSNQLSGSIPKEIGQDTTLTLLSLNSNLLSGPITPSLGKLPLLRNLTLSNNRLEGPIPESLQYLPLLAHLDTSHNTGINGSIPGSLAVLTTLQTL
ncbi:unnamed protein product, partial [Closterium sp. Yama58-4]